MMIRLLCYLIIIIIIAVVIIPVCMKLTEYEESLYFDKDINKDSKYIVLIINRLGLANRLRTIADWYTIALLSNRTLMVSWEPTSDCNINFNELFSYNIKNFQILPFILPNHDNGIDYVKNIADRFSLTSLPIYENLEAELMFPTKYKSFILNRDAVINDYNIIVTHYDGVLSLDGVSCQQYLILHSQFLSSLTPMPEIYNNVKNFVNDYYTSEGKIMIGIHYRSHDNIQDWAVVPPILGESQAVRFGDGATLEDFAVAMKSVHDKFLDSNNNSAVKFFIASNTEEDKKKLISLFPGSLSLSGNYDRGSSDGMKFALVEWLILAESALIINTYGSSFAMEASQLHRRPLVGVWGGRLIHHSSIMLPYCGHLQFIKAYGNQGIPTEYNEGTTDNRKITSVSVPMMSNSILSEWGLDDVLSTVTDEAAKAL